MIISFWLKFHFRAFFSTALYSNYVWQYIRMTDAFPVCFLSRKISRKMASDKIQLLFEFAVDPLFHLFNSSVRWLYFYVFLIFLKWLKVPIKCSNYLDLFWIYMSRFHIVRQIPSNASIPLWAQPQNDAPYTQFTYMNFSCLSIRRIVSDNSEPPAPHTHLHDHTNVCNLHMTQTTDMTWSSRLWLCACHINQANAVLCCE